VGKEEERREEGEKGEGQEDWDEMKARANR
jgi:hypothetical protein